MFAKIKLYFMKRIIPILFFFFMLMETNAQNPFVGNYYGTLNGQTQTVDVGKYYIENGKMLITASNGKKVLLTKQQN